MIAAPRETLLRDGRAVTLRTPGAGDAAAVIAFRQALLAESWRNLNRAPGEADGATVEGQAAVHAQFAQAARDGMITAFDPAGRAVGNISLHGDPVPRRRHVAWIGMGVLAGWQGCGLGRALMAAAIEEADRAGLWNLQLAVRTFNEAGIALYERMGFERAGLHRGVCEGEPGEWLDEYLYQRIGARPERPEGG